MFHVLTHQVTSYPLMLGPGFFWTLTYILVIRRSFLDQTYGVPLVALCTNISWEFIFSFVHPPGGPAGFHYCEYIVWFSLDAIILFTLLKYGPREFVALSKVVFYAMVGLALVAAFCTVLFTTYEFDPKGTYSGFTDDIIMSVLFIALLYSRKSLRGQSLSIAVCRMLGNGTASLATYLYSPLSQNSLLLPFLFVAIFVFDLIYLVMVQTSPLKPNSV
jgi:hypothetical protein